MKILAVCGSGISSSYIISRNIEIILKELKREDIIVEICDLKSAISTDADICVGSKEIVSRLTGKSGVMIGLSNMIDTVELRVKLIGVLAGN